MAGFDDLIPQAQPAWMEEGCAREATEGKDWSFPFTGFVDSAGTAVDMSTGVTAVAKVWDGTSSLVTLTYTGGTGSFTLTAAAAATAGLASTKDRRHCRWSCEVIKAGKKVQVWSPANSPFDILTEDGVA